MDVITAVGLGFCRMDSENWTCESHDVMDSILFDSTSGIIHSCPIKFNDLKISS